MKPCVINGITIGAGSPVRLMGVINCSPESFYNDSFIPLESVHKKATEMVEQGADIIDIGARSTAPNTQTISGAEEARRIDAALKELDGSGITISVDTMTPGVLEVCLRHDIHAANDISGFSTPAYRQRVAESGLPAIVMASESAPGDGAGLAATCANLRRVVERCESAGIDNYVLDPGIGLWTALRSMDDDWELCRNFETFLQFDRPFLAAVSRKSFIGNLLGLPEPSDRLFGSLAVTMTLLDKGASMVRTHDVKETRDIIRVHERITGNR